RREGACPGPVRHAACRLRAPFPWPDRAPAPPHSHGVPPRPPHAGRIGRAVARTRTPTTPVPRTRGELVGERVAQRNGAPRPPRVGGSAWHGVRSIRTRSLP